MSEQQTSTDKNTPAVFAQNTAGGDAVFGKGNRGVVGVSDGFQGVFGLSTDNAGVVGESTNFDGVFGISHKNTAAGVSGHNATGGIGVFGQSQNGGRGVAGFSDTFQGVFGHSNTQAGVVGESDRFDGVFGVSHNPSTPGVSGHNQDANGNPNKGGLAGFFDGNVEVTGDIRLLNADCAEDFDISEIEKIEPGTVMVLNREGALERSHRAYDQKVAGVISGAGDFKPAITLDKRPSAATRLPKALLGKVFCKVDAQHAPIEIGDLLTTSPTPGHAMKVGDPSKAFGAVIGKALRSFVAGQGIIPILVGLE
jgi:hypothetical protein